LYFRAHAEEAPDAVWLVGYQEYLLEYFGSEEWGRCYADWLEDQADGGVVAPNLETSVHSYSGMASVAWTFELEDNPQTLRYEVYIWTVHRLALVADFLGPDGKVQPQTGTALEAFRQRVINALKDEP
jgi:hypothetical protein